MISNFKTSLETPDQLVAREQTEKFGVTVEHISSYFHLNNISLTNCYFSFSFKTLIGRLNHKSMKVKTSLNSGMSSMIWDYYFCLTERT